MAANQKGQSLVESIILFPILLGFLLLMVRSYQAMQTSIVNQQYARAQLLYKLYNSPFYPVNLGSASAPSRAVAGNQIVMGITQKVINEEDADQVTPYAPKQTVLFNSKASQQTVKILSTISICTPSYDASATSGLSAISNTCAVGGLQYDE